MQKIKKPEFLLLVLFGAAAWFLFWCSSNQLSSVAPTVASEETKLILLDPGHGGIDGGTVGKKGMLEKEINLSIALSLRELLVASGYSVILTRETDCSIHDADVSGIHAIKVSDLRNRLALMKQYPNSVFLSIHQNHYTESKYWGAQFFYAPSEASGKILAQMLQNSFCALLQPDNKREIKPAGENIYLMRNATTTAVLAECGFLSNPEEEGKLSSEEYQQQVAFALFCGIQEYCAQR